MADSAGEMYALATVLSVLAMVAVILRFYARRMKQTALWWDDYAILPALSFTIGTAICMFVGTAIGNLGQHTATIETQEYGLMPVLDHRLRVFEQIFFATQLTQTLSFGFIKLSVLLFYKRIFRGSVFIRSFWIMISITSIWTVGFFFANLFQCWPLWINWTGFGNTEDDCVDTNEMYLAQAWSDVLTDLLILSIPPPCIWKLQMSKRQKLGISAMFLLGALTVGAGIGRLVVFNKMIQELNIGFLDLSYMNSPVVYWGMIESSLGIVGACLPMLRPFFTRKSTSNSEKRRQSQRQNLVANETANN